MLKCECDKCRCCRQERINKISQFICEHENQKHIEEFFKKMGYKYMPGFIGYGIGVPDRKTTPKWCPKKIEEEVKDEQESENNSSSVNCSSDDVSNTNSTSVGILSEL